jgi:phospholipid/cholesterol/gamma-HCH transport system substrate-binding protein
VRRVLATAAVLALGASLLLVAGAGGDDGDGGSYEVRAIFDNGGFVVNGEDVRVAGANVGSVKSVDVSMPDEIVACEGSTGAQAEQCPDGTGRRVPGKAIVVLDITDAGVQDFRQDASCLIRPQSLIGEKFVECKPTQPRAPGSAPPPPLGQIPDGERGEGQYLLPLERNGKAVDLDLIQNIQRLPYAERFRLILNDLGAGLAARGEDLEEIVRKANPALRETDQVLKILADQNRQLAQLAQDSDTALGPLARERASLSGFIRASGETAAATAERSADLELNLRKLPATLREVRLTMGELGGFADAARPVFGALGASAPAITRATVALGPFSDATTTSLRSLGNAAEEAGPDLRRADRIVRKLRGLATTAARPTTNLARLTGSLRREGAFESLMRFIYNTTGSFNGFDRFGHFLRTNILVSSCIEYQTFPLPGCVANFTGAGSAFPRQSPTSQAAIARQFAPDLGSASGGTAAPPATGPPPDFGSLFDALTERAPAESDAPAQPFSDGGVGVLDYLLGP